MVEKALIDLTLERNVLRALYAPPAGKFVRVDVPALPFAILDGAGPPVRSSIEAAVKLLYMAVYTIRCQARERAGKSFVEAPVEVLYWADDARDLQTGSRDRWHWRVQITLPVWADAQSLVESVADMGRDVKSAPGVRWDMLTEGECVQFLHIGQTDDLPQLLTDLYGSYLPRQGLEPAGPYHEIYLGDWNRVSPAQRKIILRQPVSVAT